MEKIWKEVPGFPGYEVSEYGDLRRAGKQLKPERVHGSGRKRFRLAMGGRSYAMHAAHLVALAFIGPRPFDGAEVCHRDEFEHNNHYSNLRWDTHLGNCADTAERLLRQRERSGLPVSRHQHLAAEARRLVAAVRP